jgi:hypothetical protein
MAMRFCTMANPEQLKAMCNAVAAYCKHAGIKPGTREEEKVASLVLALHDVGVRGEDELLRALLPPDGKPPNTARRREPLHLVH